ncbi:MAG: LysE family transporter [Alphaproteobacteria bacterium]|nr:LysE family transporter [Alphaproteobacteria bacterium]
MSTWMLLLSLAAIDILSIASPGPNILLVSQTAVGQGRARALLTGYGLLAASLVWACIALLGLTALFEIMPSLQTGMQIAGALFLIYIGIRLWRSPADPVAEDTVEVDPHASRRAILRGFATGILNPKSLTYFATIFVLFIPADAPMDLRLSALGIVVVDGLLVYGLAAFLFSRPAVKKGYLALRRPIDRICGTVMMVFAAKLAMF